ncbi:outer membrane protein assembly factor BamA [Buchnera aphidicola]|uniref:Outer membrane protein assembly factor BamA n=1 Tax=Buchnera aphidicola str. USDA (Myzus persicae) TaxID=1009856 RepID=W0P077_BUCMP|nr:outer membrane protein assembly factor BamA [Buchnera aphidicola]AHG60139.1 Yaet [Buchnera aphidicola str. USDA (Myzus persicae)]AHG60719.1 Yaet [Buchnera aphidicola str. W106 (Myzus persicae)]AHG61291.1 Yaet [Buchnera aphidicola str. G002 (Myzus persicae)]AHG61864.1 Yaet [Buchnera aphidicola str. F009 (Myzus persicae)]WAI03172.1 MAG: outer membrane protein assembly factor BamA [Buchnera aphidicola (Myzus persicae)]
MLIKKIFLSFFLFFSLTVCAKNTWTVKDIQFQGLKNFSKNETLKNIFFSIGNKISEYDVKNSIKSLFQTGKFEDIKVIYSGKTIIFNVKERPIISNIIISGNSLINNTILEKYLKKLNIKKGDVFNPFFVNIFIKTIEDFYYNLGRYKANVKILKFFSKENNITLKILIDEGVITKINSIKIFGNNAFSEEKIMSLFKLKSHSAWWNFLDKNIYSPKEFNKDLDSLSSFYLNQGYFYFKIDEKKINFFQDKNYVDIVINIFEGKKYKISHFFLNGNFFPYEKHIKKIVNISINELYNQEKIDFIKKEITRLLSEFGYINAEVTVNPRINHEKKTITLDFNINIKKRYFVKRIHFRGNELTQDEVLRREIKQMEGKYFNATLVESGRESLEKTKYFSEVQIIKNIDSHNSNQVNITYIVKEKSTGSINFGLGYGIDSGVSFNTSFSQKNIFGSGNSLKASAIKNKNQKYTDLSINYPYFISNNIDLNTRLFYNDLKYNLNNISNLTKNTYGFESNLGFLINDTNKVNLGIGYTHNGIINTEKKEKIIPLIKKSLNKNFLEDSLVNDFTLNYSWIYDSLKYFYFPISGNQTYISGKNTIPGSDNNFYKIILDSEEYIPLNKKHNFIFLSHIHLGLGNSFNEEKLPFYENFYANSINNIRGFRVNSIGPKKNYNNSDLKNCIKDQNNQLCESVDSIGGNSIFITNLELITPLPFINHQYSEFLRSSFFLDAGNIWDVKWNNINSISSLKFLKNNSLNDIYASYGFSLQWFSPIGPLVFSYAFPIQKNKNHQLEAFQFNFGKNW